MGVWSMASILIVDDEPTLRQLLRTVLERAGYEVAEADNGNEAMGIIRAIELDLVITDIFMPENDGFELIQHLRRAAPRVKIIGYFGRSSRSLPDHCTATGCRCSSRKTCKPSSSGKRGSRSDRQATNLVIRDHS